MTLKPHEKINLINRIKPSLDKLAAKSSNPVFSLFGGNELLVRSSSSQTVAESYADHIFSHTLEVRINGVTVFLP